MSEPQHVDVAIVGGGIVGFAVAYFLAARQRVAVLEAESRPGYHATGRSAALLIESYEGPVVRELTRRSRALLREYGPVLADHPLLTPRGHLVVATADRIHELDARAAELGDVGDAVEVIDQAAALSLCPILRPDAVTRALWEPQALDVDVAALLQGFVRGARALGATVLPDSRVERLAWSGGTWTVETARQRLHASTVINAAGAWAQAVGLQAGAQAIELPALRRTALLVDPPVGVDVARWPFVTNIQHDLYFKPDAGKLMVSPADETPSAPADVAPDDYDVAVAVDRLEAMTELSVRRVSHTWAGLRTFAADRRPLIGWDTRAPRFCWAAGLGGFGVQTAAAVGALVASVVTGDRHGDLDVPTWLAHAMAPSRFAAG